MKTIDARGSLRQHMRALRRAIPAADRIAAAEALGKRLISLDALPECGHFGGYWAVDGEISLHAWQLRLPPDQVYCLPVLHGEGRLRFAPWRPGDPIVTNRHGIPEPDVPATSLIAPEAMSVVITPLVVFDTRCTRLGMGAGWYDRSFAFRKKQAVAPRLIGAAFSLQQADVLLDVQAWDVPLDAVCTEDTTFQLVRRLDA